MSTRCQIKANDSKCIIYKHCDGYPEGVLPFLKPFVKKFVANRGNDPDYFIAQYLRHLAVDQINKNEYENNELDFLGYGIGTEIHGDIDYLYTVNLKKGTVSYKKM